ncbi:MAG: hypothetical protein AAFZ17_20570 [Cyanobacteria bacterium J06650_10]
MSQSTITIHIEQSEEYPEQYWVVDEKHHKASITDDETSSFFSCCNPNEGECTGLLDEELEEILEGGKIQAEMSTDDWRFYLEHFGDS